MKRYYWFALSTLALLTSPLMADPLFKYNITKISDGPVLEVTRGKTYLFEIQGVDSSDMPPTSGAESLINITLSGPGATILAPAGGNPYTPDPTGKLSILIRWNAAPGDATITVRHNTNPSINGTLAGIKVQPFVQNFDVALPDGLDTTAGLPFRVTVTALDSGGGTVTSFKDTITLSDDYVGDIVTILGSSFVNGVFTTNVTLIAGDWNTHINHVKARNTVLYNGQGTIATGTSNNVTVRPAAYNRILMLFPGETPTPGIAPGKTGSAFSQVAEAGIVPVHVFATDQYYNQLDSSYPPGLTVSINSSVGADSLPLPSALVANPLDLSGQIVFHAPLGNRTITATPSINIGNTSQSIVTANPGAVAYYAFTAQPAPGSIQVADVPFSLEITAYDAGANIQTQVNGPVTGALSANLLPAFDSGTKYIDTNSLTVIPDNTITFSSGVALINNRMLVTREWNNINITFNDGKVAPINSNTFRVVPGTPKQVVMTILGAPGQTFTPGQYPGNSGTPPAITAGSAVNVELRICDGRWNVVTGALVDATSVTLLGDTGPTPRYISVLGGNTVDFPATGVIFGGAAPAVTFRTAATQTLRGQTGGAFAFLSNSSQIQVNPGPYDKLMLVGPGETAHPGIPAAIESDGKVGSVSPQLVAQPFTLRVIAADALWNPINVAVFPLIDFDMDDPDGTVTPATPIIMGGSVEDYSASLKSLTLPQIKVYDVNEPAKFQIISINSSPGVLHHFRFTPTLGGDKSAGIPFSGTVQAEDVYNNVITTANIAVNLLAHSGATTMSPELITLTNGTFTGDFTIFTATPAAKITMSRGTISSISGAINVQTHPDGYRKLVLLLPGETITPGLDYGNTSKSGIPSPVNVGTSNLIRVISTDRYFNPLDTTGEIQLSSNRYAQFSSDRGFLTNVDGHGEFSSTVLLRTASSHTITALDINLDGTVERSSSVIQGLVGAYKKLQLVAPGEIADPGTFNAQGKSSSTVAASQKVGVPFNVQIRAVDDYWNIVPINSGDIHFWSDNTSAILFNPLNNEDTGTDTPRPFINGVASREIILGTATAVQISAKDNSSLTKTPQTITINGLPGPLYSFNTAGPLSAQAGQAFGLTIVLQDGGTPVLGYNEPIYLTPVLEDGSGARGHFTPDGQPREFVMSNGSVTITDLTYDYVEKIRIRLQDTLGRVAFSDPIDIIPTGLKYDVITGTVGVAGPPLVFPITVRLLERTKNTLVKNHDHEINIAITSAFDGLTEGLVGVTKANIKDGVVTFQQSYTKAETVKVTVSESALAGDPGFVIDPKDGNNNVRILPDGYKKLLLLAPGEVHKPGIPSATGKDSTAKTTRQLGVPFLVQIRGVDQFWNTADQFSGGQIELSSEDNPVSLTASNPSNQKAPLINGESASTIALYNSGDIKVNVFDSSNAGIAKQETLIKVGGNFYEITVPAAEFAGPPTTFGMNIVLKDSLTNNVVIGASHMVDLLPIRPDGSIASGNLGIKEGLIVNGILNIPTQSYSVAETVAIRVIERTSNVVKNQGQSNPIQFTPRQIRYAFELPAEAEVNQPFTVIIRVIDQDTGTNVVNLNRSVGLEAYSTITGLPVTGVFVPSGANVVNVSSGIAIVNATYNKAEPIFLRLTDNTPPASPAAPTQAVFNSQGSINIKPGAFKAINMPAEISLQSNDTLTLNLVARDSNNNPIPNQRVSFSIVKIGQGGDIFLNGQGNGLIQEANALGELSVKIVPTDQANGDYRLITSDADRPSGFIFETKVNILGFPNLPPRAPVFGGNRIPLNTPIFLDLSDVDTQGGSLQTYYRINGGVYIPYNPTTGIPGFLSHGEYEIDYYSELCYGVLVCTNPVSQLSVNGAPLTVTYTTVEEAGKLAVYPNPFNPKDASDNLVGIQYPLTSNSSVEIDIYDLFGQKVRHINIEAGATGGTPDGMGRSTATYLWNGTNEDGHVVANGGYVVVVKINATGQKMKTKLMVVK